MASSTYFGVSTVVSDLYVCNTVLLNNTLNNLEVEAEEEQRSVCR